MAHSGSTPESGLGATSPGPQQLIASFPDNADAQRLADPMSDDGLPVEHVRIIGDNVRHG